MPDKKTPTKPSFPWSAKKICCLINIILYFVALGLLFLPMHQTITAVNEAGESTSVIWAPLNVFLSYQERNLLIFFLIATGIYLVLSFFSLRFLFKSFFDKDPTTDKEDKYFVYGHFLVAVSDILFALLFTAYKDYLAMTMYILLSIYYFVFIYIHYKKLTYY